MHSGGDGNSHHCQLLQPVPVNAQILKGKGKYELLPVKVDNGAYHADGLGEDGCQGRAGYSNFRYFTKIISPAMLSTQDRATKYRPAGVAVSSQNSTYGIVAADEEYAAKAYGHILSGLIHGGSRRP